MTIHLHTIGIFLILLAISHAGFPRYFNWKKDTAGIQLINRQFLYIHAFFIGLFVLLIGLLCVSSAEDLQQTSLGRRLSFGIGLFWLIRFLFQFLGYSSELWRGKTFETTVHVVMLLIWAYLSFAFLWVSTAF